ncbi:MAG: ABC transporter ATP-binding protein [Nitrospiraceae bacterium]|nr:ABC transporter ATP-binding protein [Nitrospiraceae bacterium]MDA8207616.1 ABC transporter ATP-binding protein [Actinomycetota bacterium]
MTQSDAHNSVTPILRAEGIVAGYDGPPILNDVEVSVNPAELTVILGPNGAGKSTLAKVIIGLLSAKEGKVFLGDENVLGLGPHQLVRKGLAYLPQVANIFDEMTVLENLEMGGFTYRGDLPQRIQEVFSIFPDLADARHRKAAQLSGGQQRMVALARMLMTDPKVAILDEPTAGLSPLYSERVWQQVARVRDMGVGMLVVEQNAKMAMAHADRAYLLAQGRNAISGNAKELAAREEVAAILVG